MVRKLNKSWILILYLSQSQIRLNSLYMNWTSKQTSLLFLKEIVILKKYQNCCKMERDLPKAKRIIIMWCKMFVLVSFKNKSTSELKITHLVKQAQKHLHLKVKYFSTYNWVCKSAKHLFSYLSTYLTLFLSMW